MYKQQYEKYKRQYLELKGEIQDNGGYIDRNEVNDENNDPEYMKMDHLTWSTSPTYAYTFPKEMQDSVSMTDSEYDARKSLFNRLYTVQDVGIYGKARGINVKPIKFADIQYVKLSDGPFPENVSTKPDVSTPSKIARQTSMEDTSDDFTSEPSREEITKDIDSLSKVSAKKILLIDNLDDFDSFTEMYGSLNVFLDENIKTYGKQTDLLINWDKVEDIYKGVFLKNGLKGDRFDDAFYKGTTYPSWWKSEFTFPDVLMFVKPLYERYPGKPIVKPFEGSIFKENDLTPDDYVDIWSGPDPTRVVLLDKFEAFDEFTNKYGSMHGGKIMINWKKANSDYRGFYIDKDNTYKKDRYKSAFLSGEKHPSWWKGEGVKGGVVYVFE